MLGCHVHAKNTLDLNYIAVAERHGAEVFPLHSVFKIEPIEPVGTNGYKVNFVDSSPSASGEGEEHSVRGKLVIIAAGSLGSTELLLRSRDVFKTLPKVSRMLGTRFSGNGDFLLAGTFETEGDIDPGCGPSITAGLDVSTSSNQIYVEDLGFPDPFLWYLESALPLPSRLENLATFFKLYLLRAVGLSKSSAFSVGMDKLFKGGLTTRFMPYLGMGTDAGDGSMTLDARNNIDIDWKHRNSRAMFREMEEALREISGALKGRYKSSLLWGWPTRKLLTAHPLGGCIMGEDRETGVVNEFGNVFDYPNLYVADAAIIPTAIAINPSATICALAERLAHHLTSQKPVD